MLNTLTNFMASVNDTDISSLLTSIGSATGFNVTVTDMLFALILSVVMGFLISLVYIFTHRKSGYTQSYVLTILMLPPIIAIVLVMINSMASALSLAGVFTLCRYRTVPGDPKDITYVFFAMAVGVICGINSSENVWFVFVFFAVIAAVLILVEVLHYGICKTSNMTLKITIPENLNYEGLFSDVFSQYLSSCSLEQIKTTNMGTLYELQYRVVFRQTQPPKAFFDELRCRNGNLNISCSRMSEKEML